MNVLENKPHSLNSEGISQANLNAENATQKSDLAAPITKPKVRLSKIQKQNLAEIQNANRSFLLFDGTTKNIEDLKVGDELMGDDSKPSKILKIEEVTEETYIVEPVKGDKYVTSQSQMLSLIYSANPGIKWNEETYQVRWLDSATLKVKTKGFPIKKYKEENENIRHSLAKNEAEIFKNNIVPVKNLNIPVTTYLKMGNDNKRLIKGYKTEVVYPDQEFEIDPYILGYWLGDGDSGGAGITTADKEIVDYFTEYFDKLNLILKQTALYHYYISSGTKTGGAGRNPFLNFLKESKLIGNKHIPLAFLRSSRQNRLKLLAGLLDSDGHLPKDGGNCYEFVQKRENLLDDVVTLCRSLGFSCYKVECQKTCTNSSNGPVTGTYFRIRISGEGLEEIPVLLERKKAKERRQIKNALVTGIELKSMGLFPNYKIFTDTPRFIMSDFTVRHSCL